MAMQEQVYGCQPPGPADAAPPRIRRQHAGTSSGSGSGGRHVLALTPLAAPGSGRGTRQRT